MSIIINDFEVMADPPEPPVEAARRAEAEPEAARPNRLSPQDVREVMEREADRRERLRAH